MAGEQPDTRRARTMERVRARKEQHKRRSRVYRAGVITLGICLVLAGLLLALPGIPGPGLLVVAIGLGLLALEFDRAEQLLDRVLHKVEQAGEAASRASGTQKAVTAAALLAAAAAAVAAALLLDVPFLPL